MASIEQDNMKKFEGGATRNRDERKLDYEGFLSPVVLKAYAEYMHDSRTQSGGTIRASDNWQEGIPFDNYMKSLLRHVVELWEFHRTGQAPYNVDKERVFTRQELLSAILFNVMGYFKELLLPSALNVERQQQYTWKNPQENQSEIRTGSGLGAYRPTGSIVTLTGGMDAGRNQTTQPVSEDRIREEDWYRAGVSQVPATDSVPGCKCR